MKNEFMIYTSEAEWKDVPDFIGIYQASSDGMVRSLDRMVNHWQGGKCFKRGKILNYELKYQNLKMKDFKCIILIQLQNKLMKMYLHSTHYKII